MKLQGYRVELVYPNDETDGMKNFENKEDAMLYYNQLIELTIAEKDNSFEYATIYSVVGDEDNLDDLDITDFEKNIETYTF